MYLGLFTLPWFVTHGQKGIVKPMPQDEPSTRKRTREQALFNQCLIQTLLATLVLFMIGLQLWTLITLNRVRRMAHEQVGALAEQVRLVQDEVIRTNIHISQDMPVQTSMPINQTFDVPVDTTVFIEKEVTLSFGDTSFPIPLELDIPINTTVPVEINESMNISMTIPLDLHMPVAIPVRETNAIDYLEDLHSSLLYLEDELDTPDGSELFVPMDTP
jgi:hypothetical protein